MSDRHSYASSMQHMPLMLAQIWLSIFAPWQAQGQPRVNDQQQRGLSRDGLK